MGRHEAHKQGWTDMKWKAERFYELKLIRTDYDMNYLQHIINKPLAGKKWKTSQSQYLIF